MMEKLTFNKKQILSPEKAEYNLKKQVSNDQSLVLQ